jgi:hypothetical protein
MLPIQFFLIVGLLVSLGFYWSRFRSALWNRLLSLAFLFAGLTAILFPQYTQVLAEYMGVGRGTDLVMYFFYIAAIFFGVLFFAKLARVERCQTEIVRTIAIASARPAEREPRGE